MATEGPPPQQVSPQTGSWAMAAVARVVTLVPVALALLIAALQPSYYRPMVQTRLGLAILGVGVLVVAGCYAMTELAVRVMRPQRLLGVGMLSIAWLVEFVVI